MCDRGCGKVLEESKLVRGFFFCFSFSFFKPATREAERLQKQPAGRRSCEEAAATLPRAVGAI